MAAHRDSFVLTIVCLHFCSNFSSLFFIAFVEMDIEKLRYQLATMLVLRQVKLCGYLSIFFCQSIGEVMDHVLSGLLVSSSSEIPNRVIE